LYDASFPTAILIWNIVTQAEFEWFF